MKYREMLTKLESGYPVYLARRAGWSDTNDKVAYIVESMSLEKRENGKWIPYHPNEEDGTATDWELTSSYV